MSLHKCDECGHYVSEREIRRERWFDARSIVEVVDQLCERCYRGAPPSAPAWLEYTREQSLEALDAAANMPRDNDFYDRPRKDRLG